MEGLDDLQLIELIKRNDDSQAIQILFTRYRPVLARLQRQFYLPGHDADDWEQEARLVLYAGAHRFNTQRSRSFGAFYRLSLTHRVYDLIRQSQAQKRRARTISVEAQGSFFADTLVDHRVTVREGLELQEAVGQLLPRLSPVERTVFCALLKQATPEAISVQTGWPKERVVAALHRCRRKLRQLLAE
ncbi:sigma-70 family RNA polymerase sigma factor [Levilactobacillus suantsaii]|uniref:Sigma-70 family RNA polymerase sigma factor n=1 Tax=Levilactobacillus suantsaii TaxID=2292255 RepID=A0A4Q0VMM6_9LACO|nr:sigma-70 family RNA polymerase sigma factor [Levilactobacillus suantsaii]QMU07076.1 sigma-70 family RNA polymerase sigma factor [Levilactobacillus suantsaii]RXI80148.1 sigma-70 family RNA polymerase sigma factor [Levilactobacillus suantsaii]